MRYTDLAARHVFETISHDCNMPSATLHIDFDRADRTNPMIQVFRGDLPSSISDGHIAPVQCAALWLRYS